MSNSEPEQTPTAEEVLDALAAAQTGQEVAAVIAASHEQTLPARQISDRVERALVYLREIEQRLTLLRGFCDVMTIDHEQKGDPWLRARSMVVGALIDASIVGRELEPINEVDR
jgi:hypothetical protein